MQGALRVVGSPRSFLTAGEAALGLVPSVDGDADGDADADGGGHGNDAHANHYGSMCQNWEADTGRPPKGPD